jgi:hypothetical protein
MEQQSPAQAENILLDNETGKALKEATSILEKFKLPKEANFEWGAFAQGANTIETLPKDLQKKVDETRAIIRVPQGIFPQLVREKRIAYVYQQHYSNDNSGGYGPSLFWFITKNKLRVLTETGFTDGGFMENVLYPSCMAQKGEVSYTIGDRKTSFEEIERINKEKGFMVFDPVTGAWVNRIKLLSPKEAKRFKGGLVAFQMGKD